MMIYISESNETFRSSAVCYITATNYSIVPKASVTVLTDKKNSH